MASRWGVSQVRVADLPRIAISRLEERVGYLGARKDDDPPEHARWEEPPERDEPGCEEDSRG